MGRESSSEQGDGGAEENPPEEGTGDYARHEQDGGGNAPVGIRETEPGEYGREEQNAQGIGQARPSSSIFLIRFL